MINVRIGYGKCKNNKLHICGLLCFIISLQENTSVMLLTNCTKENATISSNVILAR